MSLCLCSKAAGSEDTSEISKGVHNLSLCQSGNRISPLLMSRAEVRLVHLVLECIAVQGFFVCSGDVWLVT